MIRNCEEDCWGISQMLIVERDVFKGGRGFEVRPGQDEGDGGAIA